MKAVVALGSNEPPFTQIKEVAKPTIRPGEILVKTVVAAANPTDWKHIVWFSTTGTVGSDGAGIVEEVGSDVVGFKKGDFVSSFGRATGDFKTGTFSEYYVTRPGNAIKYTKFNPDTVLPEGENPVQKLDNFEAVSTVTLGLSTVGVSFASMLGLTQKDKGQTILIWGGATATGVLAIQIAKLVYGLKVITTASKKNFDFVKSFGADYVFDYNDANVTGDIKKIGFKYALDSVSTIDTLQAVYNSASEETVQIDTLLQVDQSTLKTDPSKNIKITSTLVYDVLHDETGLPGATAEPVPEIMKGFAPFWNELLPAVIDQIKTTKPLVLKKGLESGEEALSLLYNNKVSGQKVVFRV